MVGIEGTTGSVTNTTHRAEVTTDNKLAVFATGSNSTPVVVDISGVSTFDEGLVTIGFDYYRVHQGLEYQTGSYRIGIPLDGSGGMLINTGSTDLHAIFTAMTDGDAILEFFENVTVSNSGTSLPIYNRHRNCGSILNSTIWDDPTVTTSGAMIHSAFFLGGSGADTKFVSEVVNITPAGQDIILNTGSSYWIKITNKCGRDMNLEYNYLLHEH